jgi:hypothetical protein
MKTWRQFSRANRGAAGKVSSPYLPITGTDAFWDGSVPNPMIGSLNNPTSSLSNIRPEASAAGAGHSLHSRDLGPPRGSIPIVSSWKPSRRERTTTDKGWSDTGKIDAHRLTRYRIQGAWLCSLRTNAGQTGGRVIKGTNHWVWDRTIPKSVSSCNWKVRTTGICRKFHLHKFWVYPIASF